MAGFPSTTFMEKSLRPGKKSAVTAGAQVEASGVMARRYIKVPMSVLNATAGFPPTTSMVILLAWPERTRTGGFQTLPVESPARANITAGTEASKEQTAGFTVTIRRQ